MEDGSLLDDYGRVILLVALAYAGLRLSRFGAASFDRRVLAIAGSMPVLAIAIFYLTRSSEFLAAALTAAVLWVMAAVLMAGRPGFRLEIPAGPRRTALLIEAAAVAIVTIAMIRFRG